MFENDYIMRMFLQLSEAIRRSLNKEYQSSEDELRDIERAIGDAVDLDANVLLSLTPESVVSLLQLGNFDPELGGYIVRALFYEADLFEQQDQFGHADLRRSQAKAIAETYGIDVSIADATPEMLEEYFAQLDNAQLGDPQPGDSQLSDSPV